MSKSVECRIQWLGLRADGASVKFDVPQLGGYWLARRSCVLRVFAGALLLQREAFVLERGDVVEFAPDGAASMTLTVRRGSDGLVLPVGKVLLDDDALDPGGVGDERTDDLSAICPECEREYGSALSLVQPCPRCNWSPTT